MFYFEKDNKAKTSCGVLRIFSLFRNKSDDYLYLYIRNL